jgi:hypothetical protein
VFLVTLSVYEVCDPKYFTPEVCAQQPQNLVYARYPYTYGYPYAFGYPYSLGHPYAIAAPQVKNLARFPNLGREKISYFDTTVQSPTLNFILGYKKIYICRYPLTKLPTSVKEVSVLEQTFLH